MKVLIVEDDFTARKILLKFLAPFGECDVAIDGNEALQAFRAAFESGEPYELMCLDIMMPHLDGHSVLKAVRAFENERGIPPSGGVKVIMTTALSDSINVLGAFKEGCEAYVVKPIEKARLISEIKKLGFAPSSDGQPSA